MKKQRKEMSKRSLRRTELPENERCPHPCGKARFATENEAKLHCMVMTSQGLLQIWYWSKPCKAFHVTKHMQGRGGSGKRRADEMRLLLGTRKDSPIDKAA